MDMNVRVLSFTPYAHLHPALHRHSGFYRPCVWPDASAGLAFREL